MLSIFTKDRNTVVLLVFAALVLTADVTAGLYRAHVRHAVAAHSHRLR